LDSYLGAEDGRLVLKVSRSRARARDSKPARQFQPQFPPQVQPPHQAPFQPSFEPQATLTLTLALTLTFTPHPARSTASTSSASCTRSTSPVATSCSGCHRARQGPVATQSSPAHRVPWVLQRVPWVLQPRYACCTCAARVLHAYLSILIYKYGNMHTCNACFGV
jgi:cytochrome c553